MWKPELNTYFEKQYEKPETTQVTMIHTTPQPFMNDEWRNGIVHRIVSHMMEYDLNILSHSKDGLYYALRPYFIDTRHEYVFDYDAKEFVPKSEAQKIEPISDTTMQVIERMVLAYTLYPQVFHIVNEEASGVYEMVNVTPKGTNENVQAFIEPYMEQLTAEERRDVQYNWNRVVDVIQTYFALSVPFVYDMNFDPEVHNRANPQALVSEAVFQMNKWGHGYEALDREDYINEMPSFRFYKVTDDKFEPLFG